jgi:hypothetical protein
VGYYDEGGVWVEGEPETEGSGTDSSWDAGGFGETVYDSGWDTASSIRPQNYTSADGDYSISITIGNDVRTVKYRIQSGSITAR